MKRILLLTLAIYSLGHQSAGQNVNLPNPATNLQNLPAGSYVIAMDNTWQTNDDPVASKRFFNLKAYGLVVFLLNNNVKVKRVIKKGKQIGDADFNVASRLIKPTVEANPVSRDFKAGAFVIKQSELPENINDLIEIYNSTPSVSGITQAKYKVKVYKTVADVQVDVRHDLSGFKPKAGILDDGGNVNIHVNYHVLSGIPSGNYAVTFAENLTVKCFTFASEPHNDMDDIAIVNSIRKFVLDGGNFLAQCKAVETYENLGHFQTTGGITVSNAAVPVVTYPNADLPYSQIEGAYGIRNGGSCQNWQLAAGSTFTNGAHNHATGYTNGTVNALAGASASKLTNSNLGGGMVFYLGSHSYSSITDYIDINGIRMYMNAFLTPPLAGIGMEYKYETAFKKMKVNAPKGPNVGYPVSFNLYADKGVVEGVVDTSDILIGNATITGPGQMDQEISIASEYAMYTPYVMNILPSSDCVGPAMTVVPPSYTVTILPVSLINFTAKRDNNAVNLKWETASEQNNKGFTVQRKMGAADWKDITFVTSLSADGNSNTKLQYSYKDANNNNGITEYRLVQIDMRNETRVSEIRSVMGEAVAGSVTIFPNPAVGGRATILFDKNSNRDISLTNASGQVVKEWKNIITTSLSVNELKPGFYFLRISDLPSNQIKIEKLVVR